MSDKNNADKKGLDKPERDVYIDTYLRVRQGAAFADDNLNRQAAYEAAEEALRKLREKEGKREQA
jgi:hypothetical protein